MTWCLLQQGQPGQYGPQGTLFVTLRERDISTDALQFQAALRQSGLRCVYAFPCCNCKLPHYSPRMTNSATKIPGSESARTYVVVNPSTANFADSIGSSLQTRLMDGLGDALRGLVAPMIE